MKRLTKDEKIVKQMYFEQDFPFAERDKVIEQIAQKIGKSIEQVSSLIVKIHAEGHIEMPDVSLDRM